MQEIPFSIPVSGVVRIDEGSINITINRAETTISFEPPLQKQKRVSLEKGRTLFNIVYSAITVAKNIGQIVLCRIDTPNRRSPSSFPKLVPDRISKLRCLSPDSHRPDATRRSR